MKSALTESPALTGQARITRIRQLGEELDALGKTALEKAIEAGSLLIEAKAELPHGQWMPWLETNFRFTDRTARNWMKIATASKAGKLETVSDLSEAYQLTTAPAIEAELTIDNRPESYSELGESGKNGCKTWWDYCAHEVLARWAMGLDAATIAGQTGRPLDEVARIIRPKFIPWLSYGTDGIEIPVEAYDKTRRHHVAFWMERAAWGAIRRINSDIRESATKESAIKKLESKIEWYKGELEETEGFSFFEWFCEGADKSAGGDKAGGWFLAAIGNAALLDARHACGIQSCPKLADCKSPILHWYVLSSEGFPEMEEFHERVTREPEAADVREVAQ